MSEIKEVFELTITADSVTSTDKRFSINNLREGDKFKALEAYFFPSDENKDERICRNFRKGERRHSNQVLPRLAFQIFEKHIIGLTEEEKANFPIFKYSLNDSEPSKKGIFRSIKEFCEITYNTPRKSYAYLRYFSSNNELFVFYSWGTFSTITFVQECLKRFNESKGTFKLIYREKKESEKNEKDEDSLDITEEQQKDSDLQKYADLLLQSKNIIFRGAPGTGKTYLARELASYIVSDGEYTEYNDLSDEQKKQIEFVQFHPNYDYADFVEGIRPTINEDGSMSFELQDGIFKIFVDKARKNAENVNKTKEELKKEILVQEAMEDFFSSLDDPKKNSFETVKGTKFTIADVTDKEIEISILDNYKIKTVILSVEALKRMLESGEKFEKVVDVRKFFGKTFVIQAHSYFYALYLEIQDILEKKKKHIVKSQAEEVVNKKNYVFIIDEINRGEISKILGELFFAIDPGYRGKAGEVSTQFSNMHASPLEKFYIPDNVYIIGTMNDIDRSVDSFDFAMRRRFRFVELKWDDRLDMISDLGDDKKINETARRMKALNDVIASTDGLNENYQIGPAYFMKLNTLSFDELWNDFLRPLLQEYITGMYDEKGIMEKFENAYYGKDSTVEA